LHSVQINGFFLLCRVGRLRWLRCAIHKHTNSYGRASETEKKWLFSEHP